MPRVSTAAAEAIRQIRAIAADASNARVRRLNKGGLTDSTEETAPGREENMPQFEGVYATISNVT